MKIEEYALDLGVILAKNDGIDNGVMEESSRSIAKEVGMGR